MSSPTVTWSPSESGVVDLLQQPPWVFVMIHTTAIISITISMSLSLGLIIHLSKSFKTFFKLPIGDRIVVYLAFTDLFFVFNNMCDQVNMLVRQGSSQYPFCTLVGFFMLEFLMAQACIVAFAAVNAFFLVVLRKKLSLGKYDWRLLIVAYGLPAIIGFFFVGFGVYGPSEAWCFIDIRKSFGNMINNIVAILILVAFVCAVVCYSAVWYKIQEVAKTQKQGKYTKTAKVMMLFVSAYMMQWLAGVTYGMWGVFTKHHYIIIWLTVMFSFLGGFFNFITYIFIRKSKQIVDQDSSTGTVPHEVTVP